MYYKYEATFIFNPAVEQFENGKLALKKEFETHGIKVLREDDKGEQELAYLIRKNTRGHYMFFELEAEPASLVAIDKNLRIKPEMLKHMFVRIR